MKMVWWKILLEATLVGHHGTSKIMSSEKSVSKREGHLIKKVRGRIFAIVQLKE